MAGNKHEFLSIAGQYKLIRSLFAPLSIYIDAPGQFFAQKIGRLLETFAAQEPEVQSNGVSYRV